MLVFKPSASLFSNVVCFTTSVDIGVGSSVGNFAGLNLGAHVGDQPEHVEANRNILRQYLIKQSTDTALAPLKWLNQQHTNTIIEYDDYTNTPNNDGLPCDGITTNHVNIPLVIMTADCMPIVLYCQASHTLVCVHAGWRGLVNGILENALVHFAQSSQVSAWIGPSISADCFEVGNDVIKQFQAFKPYIVSLANGKYRVDLAQIARHKLAALGVNKCEVSPICTYQHAECYSHRRSSHKGFSSTGRMATVAMIMR